MRQALFLDRDGTVSEEVGYVNHIDRYRIFPWTASAIRLMNTAGWKVFLITNQAGVARGYFPFELVERVHQVLMDHLRQEGAHLDGIYFCPHHPDALIPEYRQRCDCRKPRPGLLLRAAGEHEINLSSSWVVGDRNIETQMAHAVGARSALVLTGYGRGEWEYGRSMWKHQPEHVAENLLEAVYWILANGAAITHGNGDMYGTAEKQ